jgi:hypothetical protein
MRDHDGLACAAFTHARAPRQKRTLGRRTN